MRILYVDVDSLRPDHLGCYGYHRDTSPVVDRLAAEGQRFTNYYASDAPCLPSRTATFCSRFGVHSGVVNHGGLAADPRREGVDRAFGYQRFHSFPRRLRRADLTTAMISPFPHRHDAWQVLEGVDEYVNPGSSHASADELYPTMADWLERNATEDWFLHVNFWDPHTEYNTPQEFGNPFADDPAPEWMTEEHIADYREHYGPHSAAHPHGASQDWSGVWDEPRMPEEIGDREDYRQWVDGYDVGIRWMDEHLGKLLEILESAGVYEDTYVIVSADHGEALGELNVFGDHQCADEYTCNVPLVVRGPDVEPGVDEQFRYNVDLGPTLCDLADVEAADGWDGRSFADALTGADPEAGARDYLVVSQGAWACQRGVRWDDWLLLRTYHDGHKELLEDVMLFDLADDPHETTNLAAERPEVVEAGLARLNRWVDQRLQEAARGEAGGNPDVPDGVTDPMWEALREGGPFHARGHLEPYAGYLRRIGREDDAAELERRDGRPASHDA
jgi:arylsulfatase A-like enzyme